MTIYKMVFSKISPKYSSPFTFCHYFSILFIINVIKINFLCNISFGPIVTSVIKTGWFERFN